MHPARDARAGKPHRAPRPAAGEDVFVAVDAHYLPGGAARAAAVVAADAAFCHLLADLIRQMAGRYRLPEALRRADAVARGRPPRS